MKRLLIKIPAISLVAMVLVLASCLKGDPINTPPGSASAILAMAYDPNALAGGGSALNSGLNYFGNGNMNFPSADVADTVTVAVTIQEAPSYGKDLSITIAADPAALLDNFATDSVPYLALPDSAYTIPTATATIKSGSTTALFKIAIHPNKIDQAKNFMLPITATSSPVVPMSGNYGHVYLHTIGNPLSGNYTVTGSLVDNVVPTITGYYPMEMQLIPLTPLKVASNSLVPGIGGNYHAILSGASLSYYGAVGMVFVIDKKLNVLSVTDPWSDPLPRGRNVRLDPTGINTFDPVAGVLKVKYILNQASTGDRTFFDETWTKHP